MSTLKTLLRAVALCLSLTPALAANQSPIQTPTSGPMSAAQFTATYLNPALLATFTNNWGPSAPANGPGNSAVFGQWWLNTAASPADVLSMYDGAGWVSLATLNATTHLWSINVASTLGNWTVNGTLAVNPTPGTMNQGINISMSSPVGGSFPSTAFSIINIVDQGITITGAGPDPDAFGLSNLNTMGLRVNYTTTNSQLRGALSGALRAVGPTSSSYGVGGSAFTDVATGGNLWGTIGVAGIGQHGSANALIALEGEVLIATGGSALYTAAVGANTQGPVGGSIWHTAFLVTAGPNLGSAPFTKGFTFSSQIYGSQAPLDATADMFFADGGTFTIANVFNSSNWNVTNNFADFPSFGIKAATGQSIFGLPISSIPANYGLEVAGVSKGRVGIGVSTNTTTGASFVELINSSGAASSALLVNEAARTTPRYGVPLGSYTELTAFVGSGLILGVQNGAGPLILGTHNSNRIQIAESGCVSIGNTTDCGSPGIINLLTGVQISGAAASGNVLRGNGTNFVSSQLACADLSSPCLPLAGGTMSGAIAMGTNAITGLTTLAASGVMTFQSNGGTYGGRLTAGQQWAFGANVAPIAGPILSLNQNTAAPTIAVDGTPALQIVGALNSFAGLESDAFGGSSQNVQTMRTAFGTIGSPTQVNLAAVISTIVAKGLDDGGPPGTYRSVAAIDMASLGAITSTDVRGWLRVRTGNTSASLTEQLRITSGLCVGCTSSPGFGNVLANGHVLASGTAPTVSSCGTSPTISGGDNFGSITAGGGVLSSCVVNFGATWGAAPRCAVSATTSIAALTVNASTTQLTIGGTSLTGVVLNWVCGGTASLDLRNAPANDNWPASAIERTG